MGRRPWLVAGALALATALWVASGLLGTGETTEGEDAAGPDEQATQVRVDTLNASEVSRTVELFGRTAPARTVTLRAETTGRVSEILVPRGRRADRGEALLRLDARDREERLVTARALVRQRELEYEAQRSLEPQGYISRSRLAAAQAELEAAREELHRAELDLTYGTLEAPFDGAIQERMVEVGDYVQPGDPLVEFVDERELIVIGDVSEQDVEGLEVGDPGEAVLATGERARGHIRYIAPVADRATRTFRLELMVPDPEGRLRAGVTAEMELQADEVLAHHLSPALLSLDDEGVLGVKVVDDSDRVAFHEVDIVASDSEGIWVTGLPQRIRIITVGQGWVRPGQEVVSVPEDSVTTDIATGD